MPHIRLPIISPYCKITGRIVRLMTKKQRLCGDIKHFGVAMVLTTLFVTGCTEPRRAYHLPPPAPTASVQTVTGRWIDVDAAVDAAFTDNGMAVINVDRWRTMVRFEILTSNDQRGELVILTHADSAELAAEDDQTRPGQPVGHVALAEARIGRFPNQLAESALLASLREHLARMQTQPALIDVLEAAPATSSAEQ